MRVLTDIIARAREVGTFSESTAKLAVRFGLSESTVRNYQALAGLTDEWLFLVEQGTLHLVTAYRLGVLPTERQRRLFQLFAPHEDVDALLTSWLRPLAEENP